MRKGEIEGRIDAQYYVERFNFKDYVKLGGLTRIKGGKRLPKGLYYSDEETDFWYLRVDDIDAGGIKFQNIKHISEDIFETLGSYELKPSEVVISIAGTIGKIALLENAPAKRIILTENCAKLQVKDQKLLPKFLAIILSLPFAQKQMSLAYIQTTIPKLGLERIYNLKIPPVPPLEVQAQIVAKFTAAYDAKRAQEAEARRLLADIDAYLLTRLGLTAPATPAAKKTFFVRAAKLSGSRVDPFFYQSHFVGNVEAVGKGYYEARPLKYIAQKLVKGRLPKDAEKSGDCKVVQISSIGEDGNIDLAELLTAKAIFSPEQKMLRDDVLVVITGATIGKIAIWQLDSNDYFLGGDIVKFQCLSKVNPYFVFAWLRSQISQTEIKRNVTGATNGHLSPKDVGSILIPLPPLAVQEEIAREIQARRAQAKALERAAQALVEQAKREVEKMILGTGGTK